MTLNMAEGDQRGVGAQTRESRQDLHLNVGLGKQKAARNDARSREGLVQTEEETFTVTVTLEAKRRIAGGVEEAEMVGKTQDGKDAIAFRSERARVGALCLPMAFNEDGVSTGKNTAKRATSWNSTTIGGKIQLGSGAETVKKGIPFQDGNVSQKFLLPQGKALEVRGPSSRRRFRIGKRNDGGNRRGSQDDR